MREHFMGQLLLLAALACGDLRAERRPVVEDRVDAIEENHLYDKNGVFTLDQQICWRWCNETERHQVVAWRLLKQCNQRVGRDYRKGGYTAIYIDGERLRVIRCHSYRESWTQEDPELLERQVLPIDQRKDLSR